MRSCFQIFVSSGKRVVHLLKSPIVKVCFLLPLGNFCDLNVFWYLQHLFMKSMHKINAIPLWNNLAKSGRILYDTPQKPCPSVPEAKSISVMKHWDSVLTENQQKTFQPRDSLKKKVKYINFLGLSVPLPGVCKHYERPGNFCQFNFWQVPSVVSQWVFCTFVLGANTWAVFQHDLAESTFYNY